MKLRQRFLRAASLHRRFLLALAAALLLPLLAPARAGAVQIYIEDAFVHRVSSNCVAEYFNGVPRLRCPPIPDEVCGGINGGAGPFPPSCAGGYSGGPSINPASGTVSGTNVYGGFGNISNEPHIEFERDADADACYSAYLDTPAGTYPLPAGTLASNFCNSQVYLCASVGYGNRDSGGATVDVAIDKLSFEVFKYGNGPEAPATVRTFSISAPGVLPGNCTSSDPLCGPLGPFCVAWDGSYNVLGDAKAKTNGFFGFRAIVETNQTGDSGNIQITNVREYPMGFTRNANFISAECRPSLFYYPASSGTLLSGTSVLTSTTTAGVNFAINLDDDGAQAVALTGGASDLTGSAIATDIQAKVRALTAVTASNQTAFNGFTATYGGSPARYTLKSGTAGSASSVVVTEGTSGNLAAQLKLLVSSGAVQTDGQDSYPASSTNTIYAQGCPVSQKAITVNVTNVHVVQSSPTFVGTITPVTSQPYNIYYRLSKDATTYLTIYDLSQNVMRTIVPGLPRAGEGAQNLTNGDSWNGKADNGAFLAPGVYLASITAVSLNSFASETSNPVTLNISLDPLQITDVRITPLLENSTSLASITYVLTEPATAYIDIYPPGTAFCSTNTVTVPLDHVNDAHLDQKSDASKPPKDFFPSVDGCATSVNPVKRIIEQKASRTPVTNFWDGRGTDGSVLSDGNYVYTLYAAMPSANGFAFCGNTSGDSTAFCPSPDPNDKRIWTSKANTTGYITIARGLVGVSQIMPYSTVVGSSPAVAGLDPFQFRYSLSRDAIVNLNIYKADGTTHVKTLLRNAEGVGQFAHVDYWNPATDDNGLMVDSGTYMVELTAADPIVPSKVSTRSAFFPVNLFRITDVPANQTPLLSGTSDLALITYQLSQTMLVGLNIYPPGTSVILSSRTWPPCGSITPSPATCDQIYTTDGFSSHFSTPIISIHGLRTGRLRMTEQWDGRDSVTGALLADGNYVFTLTAQSTSAFAHFATDQIMGNIAIQRGNIFFNPPLSAVPDVPTMFNSTSTIELPPFTIQYGVTRVSSVTLQIIDPGPPRTVMRTLLSGALQQSGILHTEVWDGRNDQHQFLRRANYVVQATAVDLTPLVEPSTTSVTIAYDPLRIYDVAATPLRSDARTASILYQVSEPMKVCIKIYRPDTVFDNQGNPNPPESTSLVKRIVGVKSARVALEDVWDGTDLRLSLVPDGPYKYKIIGSTVMSSIDNLTCDLSTTVFLSSDQPIDEIPVTRNGSLDPQLDFERNTFVFPNPVNGNSATFQIFVPFQAKVFLRLYNIAGELVLDKNFGEQAPSFMPGTLSANSGFVYVWPKANQSGRTVARGLYYAVIRIEETLGGKNVLQTVKKVLVQ